MPSIKAVNLNRAARPSPAGPARRRSGLRKNSTATFVMILAQYALGMGVNLYARVPAATALDRALTSQPSWRYTPRWGC